MRRIEGFLDLDEVQGNIIERKETKLDDIAFSITGNYSWGLSTKKSQNPTEVKANDDKETTEKEGETKATLRKFLTLKNLDLQVYRGEFICVIGDVGSGKSSLLNAIIGDMIHVPESEIEILGGIDMNVDQDTFKELSKKVLEPSFTVETKPIKINGGISYVEQVSWI